MNSRIILATLFFIFFVGQSVGAQSLTRDRDNSFVTNSVTDTAEIISGETLIINSATSLSGEIKIKAGGDNCLVKYRKRLKAADREQAEDFARVITTSLERDRDGVRLVLRAPVSVPWSGSGNSGKLEIAIELPDSCNVEVNTAYFDIDAQGPFRNFKVTESLSQITAADLNGTVEAKVSSRPLIIKKAKGSLFVSNEYGDIKLEDIDTGEELATIRNDHAKITINDFRGSIDLGNSYERITARNLFLVGTRNRVRNVSGPIELSFDSLTAGKLRINNNYGQTSIDFLGSTDARFVCKNGADSRIIAEGLMMEPTLVEEGRLEFQTGKGEAEIRIYTRGEGDILIRGSLETDVKGEI